MATKGAVTTQKMAEKGEEYVAKQRKRLAEDPFKGFWTTRKRKCTPSKMVILKSKMVILKLATDVLRHFEERMEAQ